MSPVFRLETEAGDDLGERSFGVPDWHPGDTIPIGAGQALEVIAVDETRDPPVLVVRER